MTCINLLVNIASTFATIALAWLAYQSIKRHDTSKALEAKVALLKVRSDMIKQIEEEAHVMATDPSFGIYCSPDQFLKTLRKSQTLFTDQSDTIKKFIDKTNQLIKSIDEEKSETKSKTMSSISEQLQEVKSIDELLESLKKETTF